MTKKFIIVDLILRLIIQDDTKKPLLFDTQKSADLFIQRYFSSNNELLVLEIWGC